MKVPDYFLNTSERYLFLVKMLEPSIKKADMKVLPEIYAAKAVFFTILAFFVSLVYVLVMSLFFGLGLLSIAIAIPASIISALIIMIAWILYPKSVAGSKKKNIETNLPFAALHIRALASSGVPPQEIFRVLSDSEEYGAVTDECKRIHTNIEIFGMDLINAIRDAAGRTYSDDLRQFLNGMAATISSGGDLQEYMRISCDLSMSNYKLKREKWLSTLSTYADFYVGVLIAAPLFFISVLAMLAIIGGTFGGLSIPVAMYLGIFIILPALNIMFLMFVHYTQPAV